MSSALWIDFIIFPNSSPVNILPPVSENYFFYHANSEPLFKRLYMNSTPKVRQYLHTE